MPGFTNGIGNVASYVAMPLTRVLGDLTFVKATGLGEILRATLSLPHSLPALYDSIFYAW